MPRYRALIVPLVVVTLLILSVAAAAAKGGGGDGQPKAKPIKARLSWSQPRVVQTVAPAQTVVVEVSLTSSADLANVTLSVPGGLGRILQVTPASFASLKAGVAQSVKLTINMPSQTAHSQAGVVQARAGKGVVPASLKIKITVPNPRGGPEGGI